MRKKKLETNNWKYQGVEITNLSEVPEGSYGFIYEITNCISGEKYIGKKCLYTFHKEVIRVPGKGKRTRKEIVVTSKEADWQRYWGSDLRLKTAIKELGKENFTKEILYFVNSKSLLTYYETKEQFARGVLEPGSNYINDNILGKFFRRIFENGTRTEDIQKETGSEC